MGKACSTIGPIPTDLEGLLHDPHLLEHIGQVIRRRGYAGDLRPPTLVYVGMTSRVLARPMNLAGVAASSTGKNHCVDAARQLMPSGAVRLVQAASPMALFYDNQHFRHQIVYFEEADSIPEDGPAGSAMRALATNNELRYDVVVKHPKTKNMYTRHIRKRGPTGLITTSTRSLGAQLGTRTLEIYLPDDPDQTKDIMRAHARQVQSGRHSEDVDLSPLLDLQEFLEIKGEGFGERRIHVPFAEDLADLIPPGSVRMRRDFRQLLTCIQSITFLYQYQRARTSDGSVVALLEDYGRARDLLGGIFEANITQGLTPAVRQTVEAIQEGETVTSYDLVARLDLSKATVSYRVGRAVKGGWLVNEEWRKGMPSKLKRGDPLPDGVTALPTVEQVRGVFEARTGNQNTAKSKKSKETRGNGRQRSTVRRKSPEVGETERPTRGHERKMSLNWRDHL